MKKANRFLTVLLTAALLLGSCGQSPAVSDNTSAGSPADSSQPESQTAESAEGTGAVETPAAVIDAADLFSDRDFETGYDESKSAHITLDGGTASCGSDAVQISGGTATITDEGTYILSGTLNDGMIIVNADENDKVQLILDGVSVHSETSAPLYILQADKVFVTTAPDSSNTLSSGDSFTAIDENNIDAAIFSKEDLTLNGSGTLTVTSPAGHGIVSKDSLTVTGGSYLISSASHGLDGKDDVSIADGTFSITAGKDGIHAENDDDASLGLVCILNGSFVISAEGDGISAGSCLQIQDGSFDILSGDGSDANGTLEITGGSIIVCGPTQGDTATLDYDASGTITGGTFIGTGSSMMAQSFSNAGQGVIAVRGSEQPAGTEITLTDDTGSVLLSHSPELSFAVVILSSPDIVSGETYTLTIGASSSEVMAK